MDKDEIGYVFGRRLGELLEGHGIPTLRLTNTLGGTTDSTVRNYISGRSQPTIGRAAVIVSILAEWGIHVSLDYLAGLTDDPSPLPTEATRYAERLAQAVPALARKAAKGARRIAAWVPLPDQDAMLLKDISASSRAAALVTLVDDWRAREITTSDSIDVVRNIGLCSVVDTDDRLTCGELRWLTANVVVEQESGDAYRAQLDALRGLVGAPGSKG